MSVCLSVCSRVWPYISETSGPISLKFWLPYWIVVPSIVLKYQNRESIIKRDNVVILETTEPSLLKFWLTMQSLIHSIVLKFHPREINTNWENPYCAITKWTSSLVLPLEKLITFRSHKRSRRRSYFGNFRTSRESISPTSHHSQGVNYSVTIQGLRSNPNYLPN